MSEYITDPELLKKLQGSSDGYVTDVELLKKLNGESRPTPVSQQQRPIEGSGGAAFGVFRPQGRRPESQQDREASKEMPLQTARGLVTGSLGAPADILNLPGALYGAATQQPAPYRIPLGSEDFNQLLPFQSDTPQAKLARFGGEVLAPIPTIKGVKSAIETGGQAIQTGKNIVTGGMEGLRNPVYQRNSQTAFAPLQETYYPTPQVQAFQNAPVMDRPGMLPQLEASQQPSSSLFNSPTELLAKAFGPKTKQGENLIPYQGQTAQAFGETVGRDIANQPFKTAGLPSIAGATIGGVFGGPLGAMAGAGLGAAVNPLLRLAELYSLNKLGKTAGFTRGFPEDLAQAQGRAGIQAQVPQTPLLTNNPSAPGPVNPQTMYVAPEGVAGTNINQVSQAGAQQKYAPQPVPQTPAQQSQQMAAQKLQEVQQTPQVDPAMLAKQQAMQEQIRQRALQQRNPPPEGGAPVVNTPQPKPAPTGGGSMFESLPGQRWTPEEKLLLERQALQENPPPAPTITPEDIAQQKQAAAQSASQYRGEVVREWVKGNNMVEGVPLDTSKNAYNGSNRTRAQAEKLMKAGIDSIPKLEGVTEAQTINAMVEHLEKTNPNIFKGKKKGPKVETPKVEKTNKKKELTEAEEDLREMHQTEQDIARLDREIAALDDEKYSVRTFENPMPFKPDPQISVISVKVNPDGSMTHTGTRNGEPITMLDTSMEGGSIKVYDANNKLIKEFKEVKGKFKPVSILNEGLFTEGKQPRNVSKMMTPEDTFKALQQDVPRSEMGATEGKIFDMSQAERNAYEKTLRAQLNTPKLYPMDKQLIENALKLIDKYRFK